MTLLSRYINGETKAVYAEIYAMGPNAFTKENLIEVDAVLRETFRRVQYNISKIYEELKKINYEFLANGYEELIYKPFVLTAPDIETKLNELNEKLKPNFPPLSLQYFYRFVGNCDFTWDWKSKPDIPWEGADPLVIVPIDYLLEWLGDFNTQEQIFISPDDLHKDNVSGDAYYLSISDEPTVDGIISDYNMNFIEYLRMTFENSGFTGAENCNYASLQEFCKKLRPNLLPI